MRIIHFLDEGHRPSLGVVENESVKNVTAIDGALTGVHRAFVQARRSQQRLGDYLQRILAAARPRSLDYRQLLDGGRVLPPIGQEPGVRVLVSGTGLTHLGSVQQRDAMHKKIEAPGPKSDSRKMFELGLEGGRPARGQRGAAPEWFYKGDDRILRGPGQPLEVPSFAPDGGEEPEIVGIYVIDDAGIPCRLGFAQGNEWSDHATETQNYLYLAPSKLRTCAIGPELVTDLAFDDIRGRCRVFRQGATIYDSGELLTGERNMCHSLANIEDHHFKYPQHRQAGDVHIHFFGTSKLSFQERSWKYETNDVIEVAFDGLGAPLRNPVLRQPPASEPMGVAPG
jgi:hypothetical protein